MWQVDPFSRLKPERVQPSPPVAPSLIETQPSPPEVVPGGGDTHEQPGLEVADFDYRPFGPDSSGQVKPLTEDEDWNFDRKHERDSHRICGLKRWIFFSLLGLLLVAAVVGGAVGGILGSHSSASNGSNNSTNPPLPTTTTVPIAMAVVNPAQSEAGTTIIRQDNSTELFYIHTTAGNRQQRDPILIEGLNPAPSKNTSFAALQAPGSTTIRIFYTADNNTMFDAYGSADNGTWTMGQLASDTRYGVLVSPGSGFAATPWTVEYLNGEYGLRVYYVDRTTKAVQELAYNQGGVWVITNIRFSTALQNGKIALAWVRAANFSYTDNQVLHVFYQDVRANLVHIPGYDGRWDFNANSENLGTLPEGTYLAASVMQDTVATNNTLRIMWISQANHLTLLRGKGASPDVVRGFRPRGTFSKPIDAVNIPETRNLAIASVPGGALASVTIGEEIRVYYNSLQTRQSIVEVGLDRTSWFTVGLAT
ncbi:hypothetical protein TWF696_001315 [Orbilia brochopaga]|uniref:Fucose-specific lectin n=1 Tax=Orbilia brochopaga TaxID=3140254 RepID=A0AAV9UCB8_9PEZI